MVQFDVQPNYKFKKSVYIQKKVMQLCLYIMLLSKKYLRQIEFLIHNDIFCNNYVKITYNSSMINLADCSLDERGKDRDREKTYV